MASSLIGLLGVVVMLAVLGKILMSAPVRQKSKSVIRCITSVFRRSSISFKPKGKLNAARELTYWSNLRDKGDISQEQFEEIKKTLLGED